MKSSDKGREKYQLCEEEEAPAEKCKKSKQTKVHTVTVCVVPPPENIHVWQTLSQIRRELKDPGYYRWPPHVNLLYPFVELPHLYYDADADGKSDRALTDIVEKLESATRNLSPFLIRLNKFGTFGGKRRGVLWLHPDNVSGLPQEKNTTEPTNPLIQLHALLERAFPMCKDQSKEAERYTPHMTVSHFPSLDDAIRSKRSMEASYSLMDTNVNWTDDKTSCFEFVLDRIYLLERKGDQGQFLRVAEIALGVANDANDTPGVANSSQTKIFDPPQPFPDMPQSEDEWVYNERMLLKSRRKNNMKSRRGKEIKKRVDKEENLQS